MLTGFIAEDVSLICICVTERFYAHLKSGGRSRKYDIACAIYGDHLLHCERGIHRIRRRDAQVLETDLIKAARHPDVEPHPFGFEVIGLEIIHSAVAV